MTVARHQTMSAFDDSAPWVTEKRIQSLTGTLTQESREKGSAAWAPRPCGHTQDGQESGHWVLGQRPHGDRFTPVALMGASRLHRVRTRI